jgi:hypothetical protein
MRDNTMSLKDQIAAFGAKFNVKKIEDVGMDDFYIREMSAGDRETFEDSITDNSIGNKVRAFVFVKSVCDKDGNLLFTDTDIDEVATYKYSLLEKVFNASNQLNGITLRAVNDNADVKNS